MYYANLNYYNNLNLSGYPFWIARYNQEDPGVKGWKVWQHSNAGNVAGISGNVDLNYSV